MVMVSQMHKVIPLTTHGPCYKVRSVYEEVVSTYLMLNIDTEIGKLPVTGNIGIRRVDTDQSATVLENVGGDPQLGAQYIVDDNGIVNDLYAPSVLGIKYTDYLPSLNLNFKVSDATQIRFAAAKVMARAPINRLAGDASASVNNDGEINGSSTNNPFLKPFYANQYDISYEQYFEDTDGALVVAAFYKNIDSFIDTIAIENFDFKGMALTYQNTLLTLSVVSKSKPLMGCTQLRLIMLKAVIFVVLNLLIRKCSLSYPRRLKV